MTAAGWMTLVVTWGTVTAVTTFLLLRVVRLQKRDTGRDADKEPRDGAED